MSDKLDFKKKYKNLYQPKAVPMIVDVPKMKFIMVDGKGDPNDESGEYAKAIDDFAASNGYGNAISEVSPDGIIRRHHEIYLSDPRRVAPEKMKTVVRHPIRK